MTASQTVPVPSLPVFFLPSFMAGDMRSKNMITMGLEFHELKKREK